MPDSPIDFDDRKAALFKRIDALLGRVCRFPIEDREALAALESACNTADAKADQTARHEMLFDAIRLSQTQSFIRRFSSLNDVLVKHGRWISPTYLANGEVVEVERLCDAMLTAEQSGDEKEAEDCRSAIMRIIARAAFYPKTRAFMAARAMRLPNLSDVAHYIDTGILLFYRQNYFATANVLIPAIERLLVSISGWRLAHGGELGTSDYRNTLENATVTKADPTLRARFEAHRDEVLRFLFDRFFVRSSKANGKGLYGASLINRAFALHLNEPGSYYTFEDCVTYFQVFDLFVEFVAAQHGLELPGLIPENDPDVDCRESEYWSLILSDWLADGKTPEKRILRPNAFYLADVDHNYLALHDGPELNKLLVQAGLAVQKQAQHSGPINPERLSRLQTMISSYYAVAGPVAPAKDSEPV